MTDKPKITVTVHGPVAVGKSAVALAILDALRQVGLECSWDDEVSERNLGTGAADIAALESKPEIILLETNPSIAGRGNPPKPSRRIELTSGMVAQLFAFAGQETGAMPEDQAELTIEYTEAGHSGPGYYAHYSELPEEGSVLLDGVNPPTFRNELQGDGTGQVLPDIAPPASISAKQPGQEAQPIYHVLPAVTPLAQGIDLLATVRRLRQHLAKASFATEVDRHSAGDLVSDLVDAIDERREGITGFTIRQPVPEPTTEGFAPFYFERPIGGGSVSLVNRGAREWPQWAEEAAKACNYSSPLVGMEMRRLRMQVETLTRKLLEAQRLAWLLARSAPGGEVTISLHLLQSTDWSLAELQKNRDKSGFKDTWVAKLQGQPQPAGLHESIAMIDTALGCLSTAMGDLESSPDPRPGIMVQEAMGCLRQALVGVAP